MKYVLAALVSFGGIFLVFSFAVLDFGWFLSSDYQVAPFRFIWLVFSAAAFGGIIQALEGEIKE